MKIIKPPTNIPNDASRKVFLAGSIEMGKAENWQDEVTKFIQKIDDSITILNPRRDDWDSSWKQEFKNKKFRQQVEWELKGLEEACLIVLWFDPSTKSPISLLEMGLHARENKLLVYCPEGFWRKGNVDVVAHKYGFRVFTTKEFFFSALKKKINA